MYTYMNWRNTLGGSRPFSSPACRYIDILVYMHDDTCICIYVHEYMHIYIFMHT